MITRAEALVVAMAKLGVSGRAVAKDLGVNESVVRRLRSGDIRLRDERIARFGPRLRAAFDEAFYGPAQQTLF